MNNSSLTNETNEITVQIGSIISIELVDLTNEETDYYTLKLVDASKKLEHGEISVKSPLGDALKDHKKDEIIPYSVNHINFTAKILNIS